MIKNAFITAVVFCSIALGIYIFFSPYTAILLSPENVYLESPATISVEGYELGNKIFDASWNIKLGNPKKFLLGAKSLFITASGSNMKLQMYLDIRNPSDIKITNLILSNNKKTYGGDWSTGEFYCNGSYKKEHSFPLKEAVIRTQSFKQGIKHAEMDFQINIPDMLLPHNPDECKKEQLLAGLPFSLKNLTIQIHSELSYRWTGKGGPTYRL